MAVSCKKESITDKTEPPTSGTESKLDLNRINFSASRSPLNFSSVATGRKVPGGGPDLPLTYGGWTHPSVLYFKDKWNGFTYWAALTPYPNIDSQYENVHIFCSMDGINWREPAGIKNPIEPCPDLGFNSDVNLMVNDNIMYCYWRATEADGRAIYLRESSDGVSWGEKKLVCKMPYNVVDVISPSFLKEEGKYYCYAVCGKESNAGSYYNNYSIRRMASSDLFTFNPEKDKGFDIVNVVGRPWGSTQEPWHIEVRKVNDLWMMLVTTTNLNGYGSGGRLFLGFSIDGLTFEFGNKPICNVTGSTYKSSFNAIADVQKKVIYIELWRAMMSYDWAVFRDNFSVKIN